MNNYQYRVIFGLSHFSLTGTVSTSPNLAKEGARSATISVLFCYIKTILTR